MILSDRTIRKLVVNNKDDVLKLVINAMDDCLIDINKQENIYEINLVYKVGDYFKK